MSLFGNIKAFGSELLGFPTSKQAWRLKMIDEPETEFVGQYIAENPTENIGASIPSTGSVGTAQPTPQFSAGNEETFTFDARIFAEYSYQNVQKKILELRNFSRRREDLKRSPIFIFTYGTELAFVCFVRSVGGIRYDEPRPDGSLRGATFSMQLVKIEELPTPEQGMSPAAIVKSAAGVIAAAAGIASRLGVIDVPGGSLKKTGRIHIVKDGETFEEIARQEYGSALHGDILRRAQPELRNLKPGDKVQLIVKEDVFKTEVTPQSVMLKEETAPISLREEYFEKRSTKKQIFI